MTSWLNDKGALAPLYPNFTNELYESMLNQPHLLIAGATGSGKSVLLNAFITYIQQTQTPSNYQFILIDPKKVELYKYLKSPFTLKYASENHTTINLLELAINEMMTRYDIMQAQGVTMWQGSHIYIFIDELADLLTTDKKAILPKLQRLAQLGRASKIHLVMCTQRPTKDILSGQLKVNLDSRIALRCATPQDSRNIIDISGAELLPRYGQGIYKSPEYLNPPAHINISMVDDLTIQNTTNKAINKFIPSWLAQFKHKNKVLDSSSL